MELELYELVTSDICKLVYGFLLEIDLFHIAVEFLNTTHYLLEFAKARRQNKMFIHKVNGLTLEQWLEKASLIYSVENYVDQKCTQFKINKVVMKDKNILEQIDFLFEHVQNHSTHSKRPFLKKSNHQDYLLGKTAVDEEYDENLFKNLTEKDKKILVDVFEKKDTVSEHLAQKISEQLNKRPHHGSSNIDDLAHQVAQNTVSDDIFHDLCAEMYEEGFLSESLSARYRSPNKTSPLKSPSTPLRAVRSSPIKSEILTPSSQKGTQSDMRSPQSTISSQQRINQSPICSIIQTIHRANQSINGANQPINSINQPKNRSNQPNDSTNQSINSKPNNDTNQTLNADHSGDSSKTFNNSVVEMCADKTYHVMRPMSAASDVSSVASASSMDTSMSAYSVYTTGVSNTTGSSRYTVLPPPPTPKSHQSPPIATGQFIMPLSQSGQATSFGQPTSLLLVPVVSQANLIMPPSITPLKSLQPIAPLTISAPSSTSFPSVTQSPLSSTSLLKPTQQRYAKVKPKHPRSRSTKKNNSQPYSITVQIPAQNDNGVSVETNQSTNVRFEDVPTGSHASLVHTQNHTKVDNTIAEKTNLIEPKKIDNHVVASDIVSDSPYKLDTFISFNDSNSNQTQESSKKQISENVNSIVEFNHRITHETSDTSGPPPGNTKTCTDSHSQASPPTINEDIDSSCGENSTGNRKNETISSMVTEDISPSKNSSNQCIDIKDDFEYRRERTSTPKTIYTKNKQDTPTQDGSDQIKSTIEEHKIPSDSIGHSKNEHNRNDVEIGDTQIQNEPVVVNTGHAVSNENLSQKNDCMLNDSVNLIIINGDDELPLHDSEEYENCQEITLTNGLTMNTVVVINEEPCTETILMGNEEVNAEIICQNNSHPDSENQEMDKKILAEKTASEISHGELEKDSPENIDVVGTINEDIEPSDSNDKNLKEFYLIQEPRHVYEVVNNTKEAHGTLNKSNVDEVSSKKPKAKASTRKRKVVEKKKKIFEETNEKLEATKESLNDVLDSKISTFDPNKLSSGEQNNVSLDFLKVTPAVKVLSTPKRKSSSTPRRSHVRALKFETPLKPTGLKRKCNTSPKENKNHIPFTFERVEKPKNVSRNLCEDVEMKKDTGGEKTPWDLGLRQLVKFSDSAKVSPSEIAKRRRKNLVRKRSLKNNEKKKNRSASMKTITEELNNSHDNAKCSLDETVVDAQQNNTKENKSSKTEEFKATRETISNEGSCLSLNIDDTPLKIADFQDDIQENLKTPSKSSLFPSRSLTFTPIDNIIRNNLGESESLLKIIEDINMFKETPIKEALENLSDKSKTPSPQKFKEEGSTFSHEIVSPSHEKKSLNITKSTTKGKNKRKVNKPKKSVTPLDDSNTSNKDNFSESSSTTSRKKRNPKQNQKQVKDAEKPVRRSLRSNSALNKKTSIDPTEKDLRPIPDGNKKRNSIKSKDNENVESLIQNSDLNDKAKLVISNQSPSEPLPNSMCSDKDISICSERKDSNSPMLDITEDFKNQRTHLTKFKYEKMSTFLNDCLSENKKLNSHSQNIECKENSRKRSNKDILEKEEIGNIKKTKKCDYENSAQTTSMLNSNQGADMETSGMDIVSSSPGIIYQVVHQSETSKCEARFPSESKMKEENTKEISKKIIQSLCENTTFNKSTNIADESKESSRLNTSPIGSDERRDTSLNNTDTNVRMIESSNYPLNLSTGSSNKENSSTMDIDLNVTGGPSDNILNPIKETCGNSEDSEKETVCDFKANESLNVNCSSKFGSQIIEIRTLDAINTANVILSEDESEEVEENKLFISISHNNENQEAPRPKQLTDVIKNFNWTLEIDIGAKLDLSTFSHNIVNIEPRL